MLHKFIHKRDIFLVGLGLAKLGLLRPLLALRVGPAWHDLWKKLCGGVGKAGLPLHGDALFAVMWTDEHPFKFRVNAFKSKYQQ